VHSFSETDKLNYTGVRDDGLSPSFERLQILTFSRTDNMFHFTCFNVEDLHDPSVGLMNGQLSIPGNLLRREVFEIVVSRINIILIVDTGAGLLGCGF